MIYDSFVTLQNTGERQFLCYSQLSGQSLLMFASCVTQLSLLPVQGFIETEEIAAVWQHNYHVQAKLGLTVSL